MSPKFTRHQPGTYSADATTPDGQAVRFTVEHDAGRWLLTVWQTKQVAGVTVLGQRLEVTSTGLLQEAKDVTAAWIAAPASPADRRGQNRMTWAVNRAYDC